MRDDATGKRLSRRIYGGAALIVALGIFALDVLSPLQGAVAVLYTSIVLITLRSHDRSLVLAAGTLGCLLAGAGYVISHAGEPLGSAAVRLGVSLVAIVITALLSLRNQAAAEQRMESELRYRTIFNAAALPMWEGDWSAAYALLRDGSAPEADALGEVARGATIRDANDAAAKMFGLIDRSQLIGHNIVRYHTPVAQASLTRILTALRKGDPSIVEETQFRTESGDIIDVIVHVTTPPSDGERKRVLVMAIDVTERNRAQARLAQSQAELTHVARVTTLGQLAASIAHEVNQPLSAIITYAKSGRRWLMRDEPDPAEALTCFEQIASNGTRAADVIAHIRDMSRKAEPQQSLIAIGPLIEETTALLKRDIDSNGVALRLDIESNLPPVSGDRVQIQQVLMNLMINAEQAMNEAPDAERELCVEAVAEAGRVTVRVRDCGSGIDGDPEALFVPFFTTKETGLGMGLSICRSIMERHHGTLWATNNRHRGATFTFELPAAEQHEASA